MRKTRHKFFVAAYGGWIAVCVLGLAWGVEGQTPARIGGAATQPAMMRFKRFVLNDDDGFKGMEVFRGVMPVDWKVTGGIIWKMNLTPPTLTRIHWSDASDVCAFDVYPSINFTWSDRVARGVGIVQPGQVFAGYIVMEPPTDVFDALDKTVLQNFRPDLANAKLVSTERLPDQAKTIYDQMNTDPNVEILVGAGKETFEYEQNGQTLQEVVSGVFEESMSKINNPAGVRYWSVNYASSRRALKGGIDQLKPIEQIMGQSLMMNPDWIQKVNTMDQEREQQALQNQRVAAANQTAQFNAIEARIASQSAANDAQHASYWAHSADLDQQSQKEADVQRQVNPWKDSDGKTYKLPAQYGHAWSGADGTIIMNNDPSYDPSKDPSLPATTWTSMEPAQN
jgi:hypothetical protein